MIKADGEGSTALMSNDADYAFDFRHLMHSGRCDT